MLILLIDDNNFFIEGLSYLLSTGFRQRGLPVMFTRDRAQQSLAEIVICAERRAASTTAKRKPLQVEQDLRLLWFARNDTEKITLRGTLSFTRKIEGTLLWQQIEQMINLSVHSCVPPQLPVTLTRREKDIMRAIASGWRPTHIAQTLNRSVKTVSAHKRRVMKKLNLRTTQELVQWLHFSGLLKESISPSPPHHSGRNRILEEAV